METLTKATPTAGETPRASLSAQTIYCASMGPKIDAVRDLRPEDVPGLDPGRAVEGRDILVREGE
jgi:hypothetical protein